MCIVVVVLVTGVIILVTDVIMVDTSLRVLLFRFRVWLSWLRVLGCRGYGCDCFGTCAVTI